MRRGEPRWIGEVGANERREYRFALPAGCYLRVRAEELDVELAVQLLDPQGKRLAAASGPPGSGSTLRLSAITAASGPHRLAVTRLGPSQLPGRHRIVLEDMRPAFPGDADLVAAQRLAAEGIHRGALVGLRQDDRARVERWLSRFRAAGDARAEVDARNGFVPLFLKGGDMEEAEALARQARARAREARYLAGEAASLDLLGDVEHTRGGREDLPRARADLEQALALWRRLGRRSEEGKTLYRVGHLAHDLADPERARQAFAQARDIAGEEKDQVLLRDSLSGLGAIHFQKGNYGAAERCWKETFSLSKALRDLEDEAVNASNLAAIWQAHGQIGQARELLSDALADAQERNSGRQQRALLLLRLASVDILLGDPDHRALRRYQESQEIWHELGNRAWEADAWSGIGWIDFLQQRYEAALAHFARAADGVMPDRLPVVQIEMGMAHLALRQPAVALHDFAAARDAARKRGSRTLYEGLALLHLGEALQELRRTSGSLGAYQQAIAFGKELNNPDLHAAGLLHRAELRSDAGRLKEALADGAEALHIVESARSLAASSQAKQGFFTARRKYYDFTLDVLTRLERLHPGQYGSAAFDVSEHARARVLLDLLAEGRIDPGQDLPPDLKRRQEEAQDRLSDIQAQIAFERGAHPTAKSGRLAQLNGELEAQEDRLQQIEVETRRRLPKYAAIRYPVPLGLHEVQRLLDPETALLEYALGEKSGALFVITHDGFQSFPLPAAGEIERCVHQLRGRLNKSGSRELGDFVYQAHQMYRMLVAPAAAILAGKPRLIIAPDRSLYYLPFEALLTSQRSSRRYGDLPYLLKEHAIAYVPSASVLANLRSRRPRREDASRAKSFVAFAYPVTPRAELPPGASGTAISPAAAEVQWLPEARNEVEGIAKLYRPDQVKLYLDGEAREDRVQSQEVAGGLRIHFATHAQIDEEHPELSSLQLAPSQGPRQASRGLLLAQRIFQLKLNADLVVLSACSTALGKEVTGEGLVGLTRAFLYAGAPSVVVTLWNVSDAAAPDLMISFYRHLDSGAWKAEALRQAKLEALERGGLDAQPASWAPFILIGDPR
jgi:CHAT domain-containing protein